MGAQALNEYKSEYKFSKGDITFYDTDLNETQLIKIERYILEKGDYDEVIFGSSNIIDFGSNLFLFEIDKKDLESKKKSFVDNFEKDGYFAKELENKRQVPKYKGYFEYNEKTYLMIDGLNRLTDEINEDLGVYKGVIIDIYKYYGDSKKSKEVIDDMLGKVDNILD